MLLSVYENSHGRSSNVKSSTNLPDNVTINTSNLHVNNTNTIDTTIKEDDERTRQITGGAQASMMAVENPEAFPQFFLHSTC